MLKIPQIPYKIGITGTIASGKSLVGQLLEAEGVPVLDTDKVVHQLYDTNESLKTELVQALGPQVLDQTGNIHRQSLGTLVFQDVSKRRLLENLVHPKVAQVVQQFLLNTQLTAPIRAVLVPLLFEAQTEDQYDEVWTVQVEPDILLTRLMQRDHLSPEAAKARLDAQWSQTQKAEKAHRVIDNSGDPQATQQQVQLALQDIRKDLPCPS